MRMILFFDLPSVKNSEISIRNHFVKDLKKKGFIMIQESVYSKLAINNSIVQQTKDYINTIKPKRGNIFILTITEKQFSKMDYILGSINTDIINTMDNIIKL